MNALSEQRTIHNFFAGGVSQHSTRQARRADALRHECQKISDTLNVRKERHMPAPSERPISFVLNKDGTLEVIGGLANVSAEQRAERKAISARCGHVKRRLARGESIKGKLLQFALDTISDDRIAAKLIAGEKLDDYELHLMLDVYLLHRKLGSA